MFDFEPEEFRRLCAELGERIGWQRAAVCACNDPVSGRRDRQCTLCGGAGYVYTQVAEASNYRALVRQVDERKEFWHAGQLYLGDVTITTMPDELPIAENDLVTLVERRFEREEVIVHGDGNFDPLHWTPVAELISVRSVETKYVIGPEFDVEATDTGLLWQYALPETGTRLTVVYYWTPCYVILASMTTTRRLVGGTYLPQRVVGRLKGRADYRH
jgi:hypothetical protein